MGGSPGLVVMDDNSCLKGHGFESQRHILDGHFSHWFAVKIVLFVWKDRRLKKKRPGWPIFKKRTWSSLSSRMRWARLVLAQLKSCCGYGMLNKLMQHTHSNVPQMFDHWADTVLHLFEILTWFRNNLCMVTLQGLWITFCNVFHLVNVEGSK